MAKTVFQVPEIEGPACIERIIRALALVEGVWQVNVALEEKQVEVEHDDALVSVEALWIRLDHLGFTPQ